jgi:hypothetical protein
MYGIVNKAIQDLVITKFGVEKWEIIRDLSGIDHEFFISNESYDDAITFQLAEAIAQEMKMNIDDVLIAFGEWWVVKTTTDKYGDLMEAGGDNLKDFLLNLPMFHNRVMLLYPKLTPPEFRVTDVADLSLHLHYLSQRQGLREFVRGLIQGLGIVFKTKVAIELLQSREDGNSHEIYKISWQYE